MKVVQTIVYCIVRALVRLFYPRPTFVGLENLPDEPCVIVANHTQMNGPIIGEVYFPGKRAIWCAGPMMKLREVPAYAYADFWSHKPKATRWMYKILSYLIAPLSVCVFNQAHTIAVYHDSRVISAYRASLKKLAEGANIIILPEHAQPHNAIVCDFQEGFVDLAKMYYRQTGKRLSFVPMYIAPTMHEVHIGAPVAFNPQQPIAQERERICAALMEAVTALAVALPRHKVVPYNNVSRREYPYNKELMT